MKEVKDPQRHALCVTSSTFGLWIGYLLYTLNLQEHFPAVQTFYPGNYRMVAAPIGMLLGTLAAPTFLDRYKLSHVVYFGAFLSILCCVVMPFAFAPEIIVIDRIAFGITIGMLLTKYCVFVSFAVPTQNILGYSSFLISGFAGGCALASFVALLAYDENVFSRSFRIPYYIGIGLCIVWTCWVTLFLPEGPWFFIREGNDDAASRVMSAFYGKPINHVDIQTKISDAKIAYRNAKLKSPTLITPLTAKLRSRTLISATLMFFTFTSFPATLLFYGPKLLKNDFNGYTKILVSLIFTVCFFVFSVFNRSIIYKFKRKNSMLISAGCLFILSVVLCIVNVKSSVVASIVILCLCSGIVNIWLVISLSTVMQIFEEQAKSRSIALSLACAWLGAVCVLFFDILLSEYTMYLMATISLISLVWIKLSPLPEQHQLTAYQTTRRELLRQDSTEVNV
eukprot:NODE_41_length_29768_cov_0.533924.p3 type:complete len:452 gc:universal NODE_41_length_29768_cov_0.533924:20614-19259(-)